MSWDVYIADFPDCSSIADIPDDFKPDAIGRRDEVIRKILEVVPQADFSDPSWGILDTEEFSIEFSVGKDEVVESFACHIQGVDGGGVCVAAIVRHLGLRAFDTTTGDFLNLDNPELGFRKWKAYRNRCVRENK